MPTFADECEWTNSTIRRHAATCASAYIPVQPSVIRASAETFVISDITSPAPPTARLPKWTRCQSFGVPSHAEYWHIELTTTRFASFVWRRRNGWKIGGGAAPSDFGSPDVADRNHSAVAFTSFGSRFARLSYVMRL